MALQLKQSTNFSVDVNYHKIIAMNINWLTMDMGITIASYISAEARQSNAQPLKVSTYQFDANSLPFAAADNLVAKTYSKLKALPEWNGSTDV